MTARPHHHQPPVRRILCTCKPRARLHSMGLAHRRAQDRLHVGSPLADPAACVHNPTCNDPLVLTHARALLTSIPQGTCDYIEADLRDTATILNQAAHTLDLSRPVGLLLLAVAHFLTDADGPLTDADGPAGVVAALARGVAPGSFIALSHLTADFAPGQVTAAATAYNALAPVPVTPRTHAQVIRLSGGLPVLAPGVVPVTMWRPEAGAVAQPCDLYAGVACLPRAHQ
jgi:hypothetical protein